MIRGVLGLFAFAVALCAYIVMRPGDDAPVIQAAPQAAPAVTRAATESLLPGTPVPASAIVMQPAPKPVVNKPQVATTDTSIDSTTSGILAALGLDIDLPEPDSTAGSDTADLAGNVLTAIDTGIRAPTGARDTALEDLIAAALQQGRPDAEIDTLVNTAAQAGEVRVPEVLVTSDGRVDTAVLLQSIVAQARIAAGGAAPDVPVVPTGDGTGVEVRVVQRATQTEQYRFYTVNRGDSLGAIAVKFYGDVSKYPLIFAANRQILSSPDRIRVGQRLTIPDLPDA